MNLARLDPEMELKLRFQGAFMLLGRAPGGDEGPDQRCKVSAWEKPPAAPGPDSLDRRRLLRLCCAPFRVKKACGLLVSSRNEDPSPQRWRGPGLAPALPCFFGF